VSAQESPILGQVRRRRLWRWRFGSRQGEKLVGQGVRHARANDRQHLFLRTEEEEPRRRRWIGLANLDDAAAFIQAIEGLQMQPGDLRR
jgi:hypothetical protein